MQKTSLFTTISSCCIPPKEGGHNSTTLLTFTFPTRVLSDLLAPLFPFVSTDPARSKAELLI